MAMKLDAGEVGRQDLFSIYPEHVIVQESHNGRATPQSDEEVEALAASILEHGQLQPVVVRRVEGAKVQLVAGYGRHRAVELINSRQDTNKIKLKCTVLDLSEEEGFLRNLTENIDRSATTPIDDAHNQRKLREQYGWDEARIAAFYKKSVSYILSLRKTLRLAKPVQEKIAAGDMSVQAGLDLTELPEAERGPVLEEATQENGKVNGEVVRQAVRAKKIDEGGSKGRSLKELRKFFAEMTAEEGERDSVRTLCGKLGEYIGGGITDRQMQNALEKWCQS